MGAYSLNITTDNSSSSKSTTLTAAPRRRLITKTYTSSNRCTNRRRLPYQRMLASSNTSTHHRTSNSRCTRHIHPSSLSTLVHSHHLMDPRPLAHKWWLVDIKELQVNIQRWIISRWEATASGLCRDIHRFNPHHTNRRECLTQMALVFLTILSIFRISKFIFASLFG